MKKHLKNSNSSIADLCSEEFLSYIKNPLNLKESFKKSHNYNLLKCKSIDLKNKTSQFDHEKQKLSNKNRNIRNFINTSVTFDNSADLKNNTYDEKYIKSNPNEKQNKFSIFSKNKMKKYFNIK